MNAPTAIDRTLARLRVTRRRARLFAAVLYIVRALLLSALVMSLWGFLRPGADFERFCLGLLTLGLAAVLRLLPRRGKAKPFAAHNLLLSLEMTHPETRTSALALKHGDVEAEAEWKPLLAATERHYQTESLARLKRLASTLVLPAIACLISLAAGAPGLLPSLRGVVQAVAQLDTGATLQVLDGAVAKPGASPSDGKTLDPPVKLSSGNTQTVELLAQNMIEIKLNGGGKEPPIIALRKPGAMAEDPVFQSFEMVRDPGSETSNNYRIDFAVSESVDLYIPAVSSSKALAAITVHQLPVPQIEMLAQQPLENPWPDDEPLHLNINAHGENPLQTIRLLIHAGNRTSQELVTNIMSKDKHEVQTEYQLVLEPYLEDDLQDVDIVAEVVDRALPAPLVGRSQPLHLTVASAYGRYQQALETLRQLKAKIDQAQEKQGSALPKEAVDLVRKADKQSERSPYFDGLDRMEIQHFSEEVADLSGQTEGRDERLIDLSGALNDFLFDHEVLDDRERDRDFFVAARTLSRLLESGEAADLPLVTQRLQEFLKARRLRWEKRVARLPSRLKPPTWPHIKADKPFSKNVARIGELGKKHQADATSQALTLLSQSVVDFRAWIEELEAKEDAFRNEQEQKRQQGLASARDELKELQKRQTEVSEKVDRTDERKPEDLQAQWPSVRMQENTNAQATHRLESQLRSLSPEAGERIKVAAEQMEKALASGDANQFTATESHADLAGRLLRQAEHAAQESQQRRPSRGRRRRVAGDSYYGQAVVGGDIEIKREYEVDRRYREDILNEVRGAEVDDAQKTLLDDYLRRIIR